MKRNVIIPRANWKEKVESIGLFWHSAKGDYWNESAFYEFTMAEVLKIERVTNELHEMCIAAAGHVIDNKMYDRLHIPAKMIPMIEESWELEPPSLYGRFDLAYDGMGEPKLLEYNADTPTSLVEASLAQWFWLRDLFPNCDQFNSLHEALINCWTDFKNYLQGDILHLTSMDDIEDGMTVAYLEDTARQAGLNTVRLPISKIGLTTDGFFTDEQDNVIQSCFKLYPWEWLAHEEYAEPMIAAGSNVMWIEPAWKMLLSNKGILVILWELFENHPNLLPASFESVDTVLMEAFVKKPILSREGANVTVTMMDQNLASTGGNYGEEGYVYQGLANIPNFDGYHPIIGSWIIGQAANGMGIREDKSLVTGNLSRFVPHIIRG